MNTMTMRRLPSADWMAFGVALAAVFLKYLEPTLMTFIALVVFLPSILREVGVLGDGDEWSRGIMHRAGFHAVLAAVAVVTLDYLTVNFGGFDQKGQGIWPLGSSMMRLTVTWVFLVSYVIQYWGAREGVFRILLVEALLFMSPILTVFRNEYPGQTALVALSAVVGAGIFVGLAFLARRWPRPGALLLVLLLLAQMGGLVRATTLGGWSWGFASSVLQAFLVFGISAVVLWRERAQALSPR